MPGANLPNRYFYPNITICHKNKNIALLQIFPRQRAFILHRLEKLFQINSDYHLLFFKLNKAIHAFIKKTMARTTHTIATVRLL